MHRATNIPLICVAALSRGGVIGYRGKLPWPRNAPDLRRFMQITDGKPVIMGRRTYESLPRNLDGRSMIVLSQNFRSRPGLPAHAVQTVNAACRYAEEEAARRAAPEIAVIGGSSVYAAFIPLSSRLDLTEIDAEYPGDTYFPAFDRAEWQETERCRVFDNPVTTFVTLLRR